MGRLTDALLVLLGRCAPEGTKPEGNNVDDVIHCLSEHFDGGRLLITVTDTGNGYKSDKTYAEILTAYNSGKDLVVNFHNSIFHLISVADSNFRFSRIFVKSSTASDICGLLVENNDLWTYTVHSINS